MITRTDVEAAARRITGRVCRTAVAEVNPGTFAPAGRVWFKLEFMQHSGSFKARGAFNRILAAAETSELPPEGVVAASGGKRAWPSPTPRKSCRSRPRYTFRPPHRR